MIQQKQKPVKPKMLLFTAVLLLSLIPCFALPASAHLPFLSEGNGQTGQKKHTITYDLDGGTNAAGNPEEFDSDTKSFNLKNPEKEGYVFKGWFTDKHYWIRTWRVVTWCTGDLTLYAKWSPVKYKIVFDGNGAEGGKIPAMRNVAYDTSERLRENRFIRKGYDFAGWSFAADGPAVFHDRDEIRNLSRTQGETVTLYAIWEPELSFEDEISCAVTTGSLIAETDLPLTFTYSDQFFTAPSSDVSKKIAMASVSLSAAAYNKNACIHALHTMGFEDVITGNYSRKATAESYNFAAYAIGKKEIRLDGAKKNLIIAVIRGTPSSYEWYSNFEVGEASDHAGFYATAQKIEPVIRQYLSQGNASENILWLTGHSRGAAIANILSGLISTDCQDQILPENIYGYTFGCPAVSKRADFSLNNIHNFCNPGDIVTQVPLARWGYQRFGRDEKMPSAPILKANFEDLTGKDYNGFLTKQSVVYKMELWIPETTELYREVHADTLLNKMILTKHSILQAIITFLVKDRTPEESQEALDILNDAIAAANIALPWNIAAGYVGNGLETNGLDSVVDLTGGRVSLSDGLAYSHCLELYYAWVMSL